MFKACFAAFIILISNVSRATDAFSFLDSELLNSGDTRFGAGHMAVETVLYKPDNAIAPSPHTLVAVSMGNEYVKLYVFDPISGDLAHIEDLVFDRNLHVFNISFIHMPTTNAQDSHWCLVAPLRSASGATGGVSVFDLENRRYYNCLDSGLPVDYVFQNDTYNYSLSIAGDIYPAILNTYSLTGPKFTTYGSITLGNRSYAASSYYDIPARAYETYSINYDTSNLALTTCHVGGSVIWDPCSNSMLNPIIGWLRIPQVAWSDDVYVVNNKLKCGNYLGDVHRAAIINDCNDEAKLAFVGNAGSGVLVYDISVPSAPILVWQWDNDTRHCEYSPSSNDDFSWFGSGSGEPSSGYSPNQNAPGFVFGIGVNCYQSVEGDPKIHLFVANGTDGLRVMDLSRFLNPFSENGENTDRNFRWYNDGYHIFKLNPASAADAPLVAWELRTITIDTGTFVFVTWLDHLGTDSEPSGNIYLTAHYDGNFINKRSASSTDTHLHVGMDPTPISASMLSPNPTDSELLLQLTGGSDTSLVTIYDLYGRQLYIDTIEAENGTLFRWDLRDASGTPVPDGLYFCRFADTSNYVTTRFSVNR